MGNMPNIIDIENYCNELNAITKINIEKIRAIVVGSFARIYTDEIDFSEAVEEIESNILTILNSKKKKRVKIAQLSL